MRNLLLLIIGALAGLTLVGCQSLDPTVVADAVVDALRPVLSKIEGLSAEQVNGVLKGIHDAIVGKLSMSGSVDWGSVAWGVGSFVASFFGINIYRNRSRVLRGEPIGNQPKQ